MLAISRSGATLVQVVRNSRMERPVALAHGVLSLPGLLQFFGGRRLARHRMPVPDLMPVTDRYFQAHRVGREVHHVGANLLPSSPGFPNPAACRKCNCSTLLMHRDALDRRGEIGRGRRLAAELDNPPHIKLHSGQRLQALRQCRQVIACGPVPRLIQARVVKGREVQQLQGVPSGPVAQNAAVLPAWPRRLWLVPALRQTSAPGPNRQGSPDW